jgi:hypothetical protein
MNAQNADIKPQLLLALYSKTQESRYGNGLQQYGG